MCLVENRPDILADIEEQKGNPVVNSTRKETHNCNECKARLVVFIKSHGSQTNQEVVKAKLQNMTACKKYF